jgi:hypothetical protein
MAVVDGVLPMQFKDSQLSLLEVEELIRILPEPLPL